MIELAVCAEYRIFHSEFLAKSVSDRDKAIWWHIRKAKTCPQCRTRPEEWDETQGGHRQAYYAMALQCEGCLKIHRAQETLEKNPIAGAHVALLKRDDPEGH